MTSESNTNSGPRIQPVSAKRLVLLIFVLLASGSVGLYFLSEKVNQRLDVLSDARKATEKNQAEFTKFQTETRQAIDELPQRQEQLQTKINELEQTLTPLKSQLQLLEGESFGRQIENDRQLARATEIRYLGEELDGKVHALGIEFEELESRVRDIESGPTGKRIAQDASLLQAYASITAQPTVTRQQLAGWKESIHFRLRTVRSLDPKSYVEVQIENDFMPEMLAVGDKIQDALQQLRHKRAVIEELAVKAGDAPVDSKDVTLATVLQQHEQQRAFAIEVATLEKANQLATERVEKLAEARASTQQMRTQAALDFEAKLQGLVTEMSNNDQQVLADAAGKVRQEAEDRHAVALVKLEQQRKESAFQSSLPEIRDYLIPFISQGNTQPRQRYAQYGTAAETGPVSLSKLKAHGVLNKGPNALFTLHALGAGSSNDRPAGRFPAYRGGSSVRPQHVPFFRKVQQLLRDHGAMMVEHGLLAE